MKIKKRFIYRKGMTLIELLLVIPLISVILIMIFNMFSLTNYSFKYVFNSFVAGEDIRNFTSTIQKEANQANKANNEPVLFKPSISNNELYIYTDTDGDDIPELVRYRLEKGTIIRDIKNATNNKFPLVYESSFKNEKVVLTNVTNNQIFGDLNGLGRNEKFKNEKDMVDENDHRRQVKMTIEIKSKNTDSPIKIDTLLITKSRTQYGE